MRLLDLFRRTPDPGGFARLMERALREAGETRPILYDAAEFSLFVGDKGGLRCYLGNIYEDYRQSPRLRRAEALRRFARASRQAGTMPDTLGTWSAARPHLLPRLRERMYLENRRLTFGIQGKEVPPLPCRPVGNHLVATLVYDLPDSMLEVSTASLAKWDRRFDDALDAARENLWAISKERFLPVQPGVWRSPWGDNHDASRLLLHDLVWQFPVRGPHVAVVPNRDTLLVTGADDPEGLLEVLARSMKAIEGPRPMGARPLVLEGSTWKPLVLPPDHPAHSACRRAELLSYASDCAEQKGLLDALHQKQNVDLFVASFTVIEDPGSGDVSSYSVWSEGIPTLLPRADRIGFVRRDQVIGMAPWERALEAFGPLLTPQGLYPERWRVDGFPADAEIRRLAALPDRDSETKQTG